MHRWLVRSASAVVLLLGCAGNLLPERRYYVDTQETISESEARLRLPRDRWPVLQDISNTTSINVICGTKFASIQGERVVAEIVGLVQAAHYIEVGAAPRGKPDLKVYFIRSDKTFIMAARVFRADGILASPEGPWVKADPRVVALFVADGACAGSPE